MTDNKQRLALQRLAELHGVEASFTDASGRQWNAGTESVVRVLKELGAPLENLSDAGDALRESLQNRWRRICDPVSVAWGRSPAVIRLRIPRGLPEGSVECRLETEDGAIFSWSTAVSSLECSKDISIEGKIYEVRHMTLPCLPQGYHRLAVNIRGECRNVLIISAPRRVYGSFGRERGKIWGVFVPLYALYSERSWGAGDFSDLDLLLSWIGEKGGGTVGTLPLLALYLDKPCDWSPYSPVSRLFWNEFYIDVAGLAEFKRNEKAVLLYNSGGFQEELAGLREDRLVDYRKAMGLKRRVMELCAESFYAEERCRQLLFNWVDGNPGVRQYARFRAAVEKKKSGWKDWPESMRNGLLKDGDFDPEAERYHLYVQWAAWDQLKSVSQRARLRGQSLYLDLPLGVHPQGYDTWRYRQIFALGSSSGAPPDLLCAGGQDWNLPPLHPDRIREQGYRYYIESLRNHLQFAGILRLDHVMGLHRLYWVPVGLPASQGVYVKYRADEFYAILALESQRFKSHIVGEDLGIVPANVKRAMARHRVKGMYVLPFELTGDRDRPLHSVPANSLACLNTHDMIPFASFWEEAKDNNCGSGALPAYFHKQGWLRAPSVNTVKVWRGCLGYLAASPAKVMMVNLEDLWEETKPQNVPGTTTQYPNWRRKAGYSFEQFTGQTAAGNVLKKIEIIRRSRKKKIVRADRGT